MQEFKQRNGIALLFKVGIGLSALLAMGVSRYLFFLKPTGQTLMGYCISR